MKTKDIRRKAAAWAEELGRMEYEASKVDRAITYDGDGAILTDMLDDAMQAMREAAEKLEEIEDQCTACLDAEIYEL